jgi:hypothetical protein
VKDDAAAAADDMGQVDDDIRPRCHGHLDHSSLSLLSLSLSLLSLSISLSPLSLSLSLLLSLSFYLSLSLFSLSLSLLSLSLSLAAAHFLFPSAVNRYELAGLAASASAWVRHQTVDHFYD